ncbi:MAG: response regulator [Pseudomonadota bacterium]
MAQRVVGTKEAARRLGVSVRTIQLWVEDGLLSAWKTPGGHRRIEESSLEQLLESRQSDGPAASPSECDVLIVEDDQTMQAYYQALIDILGSNARVRFAENGFEGLVAIGRFNPALVIVDVDMPGMDGLQMIAAVDRSRLCAGTRMVVISGLTVEQIAQRGELPADIKVFGKPVNVDDLKGLIDMALIDEKERSAHERNTTG